MVSVLVWELLKSAEKFNSVVWWFNTQSCSFQAATAACIYLSAVYLFHNKRSKQADLANHSTKTAVLQVLADIMAALDSDNLASLMLLDLSGAFDSVDHAALLKWLCVLCNLD